MTPYIPKEGDNFDSNYCNRQEQIDKIAYDYYLQKINAETFFQKFYFNYYDPKSIDPFFELDNIQYKFVNLHEEGGKDIGKVESTYGKTAGKSSTIFGSTTPNTPRLDLHTSSINQTYLFNNQSHLSHRKFIGSNI